jgi:hypothetical protein
MANPTSDQLANALENFANLYQLIDDLMNDFDNVIMLNIKPDYPAHSAQARAEP